MSTQTRSSNINPVVGASLRLVAMLAMGVLSSAAAFLITYESDKAGTNLMGWYEWFVIPLGPFLVGLAASSGIVLGARVFGVRMGGLAIGATLLLLCGAYFGAEYVTYRVEYPNGVVDVQGNALAFWGYFDAATRLIHFEKHSALGVFGYVFRVLDFVAFAAAGVLGPMVLLAGRTFCGGCQRYHRNVVVAHVPAGNETGIAEIRDARENAANLTSTINRIAPREQWAETAASGDRILFRLSWCPACREGQLVLEKLAGLPNQKEGRVLESHPLPARIVGDVLASQRVA